MRSHCKIYRRFEYFAFTHAATTASCPIILECLNETTSLTQMALVAHWQFRSTEADLSSNYRKDPKQQAREGQFRKKTNAIIEKRDHENTALRLSGDEQYRPRSPALPSHIVSRQARDRNESRSKLKGNMQRNLVVTDQFKSRNSEAIDSILTGTHTIRYPTGSLLTIPLISRVSATTNKHQPTVPMMLEHFITARLIEDLTHSPNDEFALNNINVTNFWTQKMDSVPFSTSIDSICFKTSKHPASPI
ncbi:hypothetical protein GJ496_006829 [Pomphorhynchus laevis]|nr:hypothetical protein GJ496_006829 [Pomphorhynchus laevis]